MKIDFFRRIMARAKNEAGERIESLRFSVPALRVGVLEYGAGQLQTGNAALEGKAVKLYYPPEAVSDEKFLKSLETAPVVLGGHNASTNEQDKKIDGWAHNVFYDEAAKAAMINGVVKGAKEGAYIRSNLGTHGFGASAFVDIYDLKVANGVTPDGQEYNAIANELRATHVALAPHVRDPENKIRVTNAVCVRNTGEMMEVENAVDLKKYTVVDNHVKTRTATVYAKDKNEAMSKGASELKTTNISIYEVKNSHGEILNMEVQNSDTIKMDGKEYRNVRLPRSENDYGQWEFFYNGAWHEVLNYDIRKQLNKKLANGKNSHGEILNNEEISMDPKDIAALVKNAVEEAIAARNTGDRMDAMEETLKKHGDALNEINEKLTPKRAEGENTAFEGKETPEEEAEEKKSKEGAALENAKPSQEMVKAFATALNVDFGAKTPSFGALASLVGITEKDPAARIAAVNAKFAELQKSTPAKNQATDTGFMGVL